MKAEKPKPNELHMGSRLFDKIMSKALGAGSTPSQTVKAKASAPSKKKTTKH